MQWVHAAVCHSPIACIYTLGLIAMRRPRTRDQPRVLYIDAAAGIYDDGYDDTYVTPLVNPTLPPLQT